MGSNLFSYQLILPRFLLALIFLMSALGILDQTRPIQELKTFGVSPGLAVILIWCGRVVQFSGAVLLLTGFASRWGARGLVAFMILATLVAHHFWTFKGTEQQTQLVHFLKNVAIIGGLLCFAVRP